MQQQQTKEAMNMTNRWPQTCSSQNYTLTPRQDGRHFADDIFKCIFLNENVWIPINISLKFVPKGPINNISALFQIMAWRRPGDKPWSEPMLVSLLTHICVTRPQWVKVYTKLPYEPLTCIWCSECLTSCICSYLLYNLSFSLKCDIQ